MEQQLEQIVVLIYRDLFLKMKDSNFIHENAKKIRFTHQNLCHLRTAIYLAQEVAKGLGGRAVLF